MKVLLVEDLPDHAELIELAFEEQAPEAELVVVGSVGHALQRLADARPDVVLSDARLPDGTCLDLLAGMSGERRPVVVLTAHGDQRMAVEAMKAGAADYVTKTPALFQALPKIARALWAQDVSHFRLVAAEQRLRHADRLIGAGQLAAVTAHEVGTPLNVVRIGLQTLARTEDETARDLATQLIGQVDAISRRLRAMLDYSRAPRHTRRPLLLLSTVRAACDLVQPLARKRGAVLEIGGDDVLVVADAEQLQQVVFNLVSNALQAGARTVRIQVAARQERAEIRVLDDGRGIEGSVAEHLFEAFVTSKPPGEGTGLGLSVCAGIAREHGGKLTVTEVDGQTCFVLDLPQEPVEPA